MSWVVSAGGAETGLSPAGDESAGVFVGGAAIRGFLNLYFFPAFFFLLLLKSITANGGGLCRF
jgi:hypothetical protein